MRVFFKNRGKMRIVKKSLVLTGVSFAVIFLSFCAGVTYAHGGEAQKLPDGSCLFKDGHVGLCEDASKVEEASPSIQAGVAGSETSALEQGGGVQGNESILGGSGQNLNTTTGVKSMSLNSSEGASSGTEVKDTKTESKEKPSDGKSVNMSSAFISFFLLMIVLGFVLVKSRAMKNELINRKK